jgi:hypothetical protein
VTIQNTPSAGIPVIWGLERKMQGVIPSYLFTCSLFNGAEITESRIIYSGLYCSVNRWNTADVSEEYIARSIKLIFSWLIVRPWRWRRHITPKRQLTLRNFFTKGLHGVIHQVTELFITTLARTSDRTYRVDDWTVVGNGSRRIWKREVVAWLTSLRKENVRSTLFSTLSGSA